MGRRSRVGMEGRNQPKKVYIYFSMEESWCHTQYMKYNTHNIT